MSTASAVSVIIPALNASQTLPDLLLALKSQVGMAAPFETIVVDNGSTDRTVEVAKAAGVKVLHQPVRGPSAARNFGLVHAQGEIVVCADADTIPTRRWLASLVSAFTDPATIQATGPIFGWQPTTGAERFASVRDVFDCKNTARHPYHPFAHGMNVGIRRAAALEIDGWDETMGSGEDVDFSVRLRKKFGSEIRFVDQAVMFHKHRATDEALWKQARWHGAGYAMVRNRHPELLPWPTWRNAAVRASLVLLRSSGPMVAVCRATRIISRQRAEFEYYNRQWATHFWSGFFEECRKKSP
jgi:glycosyltransferase involved in cell wall biosynthesis